MKKAPREKRNRKRTRHITLLVNKKKFNFHDKDNKKGWYDRNLKFLRFSIDPGAAKTELSKRFLTEVGKSLDPIQ